MSCCYSPEGPGAVGDVEGGDAAVGLKAVDGPESEQLLSGSLSGSWLGGGAGCGNGKGCRGCTNLRLTLSSVIRASPAAETDNHATRS